MLLRVLLISLLVAAITTVMAAPPRFGFQPPEGVAPVVNNGGIVGDAAPATPSVPTTAPAAAPEAQAASKPESAASGVATVSPDNQTSAKPEKKNEKRGFFWMFQRKKEVPVEPVHKDQSALVPTEHYHKSVNEKLNSAELYEYRSGYSARWQDSTSKVMCSIQQQIPNYGHVEFRQGVGQPLQFAMYVNHPPAGMGQARVRIQAPPWRHYTHGKDLGVLELEAEKRALTMASDWSNRLLLELREGMQPVIHYWDAADATTDIEIMLSALNFQESLNLFHNCLGQLLTYDVQNTRRTVLNFNEDSSKLRKQTTDQLDEILEILKTDPGVKQIDLELYSTSESLANYNFRLSTRRARAVRDYLMKRGIDEKRILIKIHTKTNSDLKKLGYRQTDIHVVMQRDNSK